MAKKPKGFRAFDELARKLVKVPRKALPKRETKRDKVLYAFAVECERPTAAQIIDWCKRYPQFAEDIRAHAAVARDWDAKKSK